MDIIWILFNITLIVGLLFATAKIVHYCHKTHKLYGIIVTACLLLLVNVNRPSSVKHYDNTKIRYKFYVDKFSLNLFQTEILYIILDEQENQINYNSGINGLYFTGLLWENNCFHATITPNGIRYKLEKKKIYTLLGVPVYSKTKNFEGIAHSID